MDPGEPYRGRRGLWLYAFVLVLRGFNCLIITLLVPVALLPAFDGPFSWVGLLVCTVWLCLTCNRAGARWLYLIPIALTLTGMGAGLQQMVDARPMPTRVRGAGFTNAPLPEVLHFLARQKTGTPGWDFLIHGDELLTRKVTVTISNDCAMEEAMNSVCRAAHAEFAWYYLSVCGNAPGPGSVCFELWKAGSARTNRMQGVTVVMGDLPWTSVGVDEPATNASPFERPMFRMTVDH